MPKRSLLSWVTLALLLATAALSHARTGLSEQCETLARPRNGAESTVERVRHSQATLLDTALRAVLANDPRAIDLYFVGVAGDGDQDVFKKEVEFVKRQFDEHFGTAGRSLLLINNAATLGEIPMATVSNIERTLRGIADKMDADRDILVVYFTSHGSPDHHLSLDQPGFHLPDLSREQLGDIVAGLPVKWKVIAVSACFSGGFIPALADPHTLVMTAANATRESFGCSDDADMTYFGRAFFERSLPVSGSFGEAFERARKLIHEWEANEGFPHSHPQISRPHAIMAHLEAWRSHRSGRSHAALCGDAAASEASC